MLFTDYRTTSNESMLTIHSHLLPIQPSRASSLLPSLLGGSCSQTRWVTPTILNAVFDFFAYKPGKTAGSVRFRGYCEPYGRWLCYSFVVLTYFSTTIRPVYRKIIHNGFFKPTPQSPYIRLAVSPEMEEVQFPWSTVHMVYLF